MELSSKFFNPIGRLMKFYGIENLNFLSRYEYHTFLIELYDNAVDLIWQEYGRLPVEGEADQIVEEWLNHDSWEDSDEQD